jgi:hypothetical protein
MRIEANTVYENPAVPSMANAHLGSARRITVGRSGHLLMTLVTDTGMLACGLETLATSQPK